jgi:hypothetical protein
VRTKRHYSVIEIWPCRYSSHCRTIRCRERVTVVARYLDAQGRPLRQVELCQQHAGELAKGKIAVRDMR